MAERKPISDKERDAVLREAGYRCAVPTCHTTLAIDVHHIVEVYKGGGNEPSNLLALCPTCHALYHRGVITQESVKQWKERLVALNRVVDVQAEVRLRLQEAINRKDSPARTGGEQREGFSLAAAEFYWRTCEIGFVWDGDKRFVDTGYCCFVAPKIALTISEVVDWATEIGAQRGGLPVVHTRRGMASFTILDKFDVGNLVAIEIGTIDDSYTKELLNKYDKDIAEFFTEPLQTNVRFRNVPFVGERVGILHSADNSQDYRIGHDFQFDSADVAFSMKFDKPQSAFQFVLTPVSSHIQHRGAPVFTAEGRLVGLVKDSILLEGERAWRPVVSPAFVLQKIYTKEVRKSSPETGHPLA